MALIRECGSTMEIIKEGPSTTHPSVLDGKNYSYWKLHMISFLKSLDGRAWRAVVSRWKPSMITADGRFVPKPEIDWTNAEEQASMRNSSALNVILNGVDLRVFKSINFCSSTKDA